MDFLVQIDRFLSQSLTPIVKRIFLINIGVFSLLHVLNLFGLGAAALDWLSEDPDRTLRKMQVWRLVTYMFTHYDPMHLLFNMLVLWFFGPAIEARMGSTQTLQFYLATGVGAGLLHSIIHQFPNVYPATVHGASGAIWGIMLAYAAYYPNRVVLFFGIFPIQIKWLVGIMMLIDFLSLGGGPGSGVSHIAHLSGAAVAYIYLTRYHHTADITRWRHMR